jgi:hypothetical protein
MAECISEITCIMIKLGLSEHLAEDWYCFGDRRLNFISIATCSVQDNTASDRLAFPKLPR